MNIIIHTIPAFQDNYFWLFHREGSSEATVVDPGDAAPVLTTLHTKKLRLSSILVTHQHADHIGGVSELLCHYPDCTVFGPPDISIVNQPVAEGDKIWASGITFSILAVPGHTLNHLAYIFHKNGAPPLLFCGDTLFAGGCGRLFEGSPRQMHSSLAKIAQLPDDTLVYCAHEYTAANLQFALAVEPTNQQLAKRVQDVNQLRAANKATIPTVLHIEKQTNPFLRTATTAVKEAAIAHEERSLDSEIDVFAAIRRWKDTF